MYLLVCIIIRVSIIICFYIIYRFAFICVFAYVFVCIYVYVFVGGLLAYFIF
jgi:hypothetical protein